MKSLTHLYLSALTILIGLSASGASTGVQEKGKISDTIHCNGSPKFSYALYLPSNYTETSKWPVIFVFDPAARGSVAVSGFVKAASKYGYIIACSNNSKNQLPWNEISDAVNAMFMDVQQKYSIDNRRIYTSGFSGGSRVASMIALQNKIISGVIACGAGLPDAGGLNKSISFGYFGMVGNRDMNYLEMHDLGNKLDSLGINSEIRVFDGGHDWPSPALLQEAVEWIEIQAMNNGTKEKNPAFINSQLLIKRNMAEMLWRKGKLLESVLAYRHIIKDFPGNPAASKIAAIADSLKKTAEYNKAVRAFSRNRAWELETQSDLISALYSQIKSETMPDSVRNALGVKISMLRSMANSKDSTKKVMASRVSMLVSTFCFETGKNLLSIKKYKGATICYQAGVMVDPPNKSMRYQLSKAYAYNNDTDNAIESLSKAVKLGYNDRRSIESDPAFTLLKSQKRFTDLMKQIK
jgi:predicted esterase